KISTLNGNLVAIFTNHISNELCFSFLGDKNINNTVTRLFEFIDQNSGMKQVLGPVPEVSIKNIDFEDFFIEIDLNSCDYVYSLEELSENSGSKYKRKREMINSFLRE